MRFLWRTDYAPNKLNSMPVTIAAGRLTPLVMTKNPDWVGRITGIALAVRGPLAEPARITGVAVRPGGAVGQLRDLLREWLTFERWSGTSINTVTGGADVQEVPLPTLLVVRCCSRRAHGLRSRGEKSARQRCLPCLPCSSSSPGCSSTCSGSGT